MTTDKLMLFPGKCPLKKDNCNGCENYEVCEEFYKIGFEPLKQQERQYGELQGNYENEQEAFTL